MIIGRFLVTIGISGLVTVTALKVSYLTSDGSELSLSLQDSDLPFYVTLTLILFTISGIVLLIIDAISYIKDRKETNNIVIEHVAIYRPLSTSLANTVSSLHGRVNTTVIDISKSYCNGILAQPSEALMTTKVMIDNALHAQVNASGTNRAVIHYGGTPPVSLGFYSGYLIGNTSNVNLWDYDRNACVWHSLDRGFDDNRPVIDQDGFDQSKNEVAIFMSISFDVEPSAIECSPTSSIIKIRMPEIHHDNMSSLSKLNDFCSAFRSLINNLSQHKINKVHIFCAAQASFNFSIGRQITKNHPTFVVYEYVHSSKVKYPWGIEFNNGHNETRIVNNK